MAETLLIELLAEELPPKSLARLSEAFSAAVLDGLKEQGFTNAGSASRSFATPRRLAVLIPKVLAKQPDRLLERKGPAVNAGYDAEGKPTPALLGFAKSCGVAVTKLEKCPGDKGEQFVFRAKQKGETLAKQLPAIVEAAIKKLPVAKIMRWGAGEAQFVRPVHGLVMLHGKAVVPGAVLGISSGRITLGHRFLSRGPITVAHADKYETLLAQRGRVIADYAKRKALIERQLDRGVAKLGRGMNWRIGKSAELIDEVASIVEYPAVYGGGFGEEFLDVPRECLIISMQQHQKYFPLADARGKLLRQFLVVSNIQTKNPKHIVHGNERVLRARLADARFFYDQDRSTTLAERVPKLANVVYHNKLGSQLERVQRLQKLAGEIARRLDADVEQAERAAWLCKADLLTDMVGEFPELQGIMGRYYAVHDGLPDAVAEAIRAHYLPRFAGDELPAAAIGMSVALADKLDTLVGIYGIGLVPTGDKDPYGLRRAALGVIRILVENSGKIPALEVLELLQLARSQFATGVLAESVAQDLHGFMFERLKPYLRERGFLPDEIDAVLSLNPTRLDQIVPRLQALQSFRRLPAAAALAAANKRIRNILRQAGVGPRRQNFDLQMLNDEAERALGGELRALSGPVQQLLADRDYAGYLKRLAALRPAVDRFFDKVMVMVEDPVVRSNRLALLSELSALFLQVADISRLQEQGSASVAPGKPARAANVEV
jgi:glycyl-tRNA synthetase beta chain